MSGNYQLFMLIMQLQTFKQFDADEKIINGNKNRVQTSISGYNELAYIAWDQPSC